MIAYIKPASSTHACRHTCSVNAVKYYSPLLWRQKADQWFRLRRCYLPCSQSSQRLNPHQLVIAMSKWKILDEVGWWALHVLMNRLSRARHNLTLICRSTLIPHFHLRYIERPLWYRDPQDCCHRIMADNGHGNINGRSSHVKPDCSKPSPPTLVGFSW